MTDQDEDEEDRIRAIMERIAAEDREAEDDAHMPERRRLTCLHIAMSLHGPTEHQPRGTLAEVLTAAKLFEEFLLGEDQKEPPGYAH